jgi:hypothetical protein
MNDNDDDDEDDDARVGLYRFLSMAPSVLCLRMGLSVRYLYRYSVQVGSTDLMTPPPTQLESVNLLVLRTARPDRRALVPVGTTPYGVENEK